jgi:putative SOS response-associated peptidase YedK
MCGRFTYRLTWEEIVRLYGLTLDQPARNTQARYNVGRTDPVDTIVERDGKFRPAASPYSRGLRGFQAARAHGRTVVRPPPLI